MALVEDENQFTYNGFHGANLHLDGIAQVHPNGLLQLTNTSKQQAGHAFYQISIKFNTSSSSGYRSLSFSTNFIFVMSFNKSGQAQSLELAKLPSFPKQRNQKEKSSLVITVSLIMVSIVLIITILGIVYFVRRKKYEEIHEGWEKEYGPQRFSYKDLYKATKGFKDMELIGAGGFGRFIEECLVAVKKVSHDSKQGMKEFVAEIASMGRLRHMNLVQLLGYCRRRGEMILVYDYMPNGSLDKDVKASNVLLDDQLNGRLGDFGLARLYDHGSRPQTTHVVGTIGYLAPELTKTGKATTSTDVFTFGAFLLEVACGRRPIDLQGLPEQMFLVDWVFEKWKQGVILETCDPMLEGDYLANEMELVLKLGFLCSHFNPATRPSMKQVMQYLDGDTLFPEIILKGASVDMLVMDNKTSTEFFKSVPSSSGNYSVYFVSSSDSILCDGR
ncbi:hypothetical protein TEA_007842 [Camellia sinensis var. sinensis]|uniref:non-specific serine/threonine protein kinase n=1 Tax=Camellia sinensis var. sinensis TaxID=542762 RepID=A0A4S4EBJ6_CAMSN|nr:hypothetical protein TEA_007842 [Camellia sinensis var. sinensis]